jgi:hypothetical protein
MVKQFFQKNVKDSNKSFSMWYFFYAGFLFFFSISILADQSFPKNPPVSQKMCCDEKVLDASLTTANTFDGTKKIVQCTPVDDEDGSVDQVANQLNYPKYNNDSNISNHSATAYPTNLKCTPMYSTCKWVDVNTPCGDDSSKVGKIHWASNPVDIGVKVKIRYGGYNGKTPYYVIFVSGDWENNPASSTITEAEITYRYKIYVSNPVTYFFTQGYNGGVVPTENSGTTTYFSNDTNDVSYYLYGYPTFTVVVTVEAYDNYGNNTSVTVKKKCTPAKPPVVDKDGFDKITCQAF